MSVTVDWIESEDDLDSANERLYALRDAEDGSPEREEWNVLADLIEAYERRHISMDLKVSANTFQEYIELWGLTQRDVSRALGDRHQTSNLMAGKRGLSITQMRKLHDVFKFPYEELMQFASHAEPKAS